MRTIKVLGIILLFCSSSFAQSIDTNKLLLNSKMMLITYLNQYEDIDYYEAYLAYTPEMIFLNSTGFDSNYIFYKIRIKDTVVVKRKIDANKTLLRPFFQFKDEYVTFAFDSSGETIYKLNGEEGNDQNKFMDAVISHSNGTNRHEILHGKKLSRKNFYKYLSIEGFDLKPKKAKIGKER